MYGPATAAATECGCETCSGSRENGEEVGSAGGGELARRRELVPEKGEIGEGETDSAGDGQRLLAVVIDGGNRAYQPVTDCPGEAHLQ